MLYNIWGIRYEDKEVVNSNEFLFSIYDNIIQVIRRFEPERLIRFVESYTRFWDNLLKRENFEFFSKLYNKYCYEKDVPEELKKLAVRVYNNYNELYFSIEDPLDLTVGQALSFANPEDFIEYDIYYFINKNEILKSCELGNLGYIIDLNRNILEVYHCVNNNPREAGPYASERRTNWPSPVMGMNLGTEPVIEVPLYFGARLVTEIPLNYIRDENNSEILKKTFALLENAKEIKVFSLKGNAKGITLESLESQLESFWNSIEKRSTEDAEKISKELNSPEMKKIIHEVLLDQIKKSSLKAKNVEIERIYLVGSLSEISFEEYKRIVKDQLENIAMRNTEFNLINLFDRYTLLTHELLMNPVFTECKINSEFSELISFINNLDRVLYKAPSKKAISESKAGIIGSMTSLRENLTSVVLRRIFLNNVRNYFLKKAENVKNLRRRTEQEFLPSLFASCSTEQKKKPSESRSAIDLIIERKNLLSKCIKNYKKLTRSNILGTSTLPGIENILFVLDVYDYLLDRGIVSIHIYNMKEKVLIFMIQLHILDFVI